MTLESKQQRARQGQTISAAKQEKDNHHSFDMTKISRSSCERLIPAHLCALCELIRPTTRYGIII